MARNIAQLHVHTKFSEKDATASPQDYVDKIKSYNANSTGAKIIALANTDHGVMYGMVHHYEACTTPDDNGVTVKPIMGCEVYHCEDRATDDISRYHMVLLAKNQEGLKNLYQIVSDAGLNKLKGKSKDFPRTHDDTFIKYGKGIIAMSACVGGIIPTLINEGKYDEAKSKACFYNGIFDEFYLEVQPHTFPEQLMANEEMVRMSAETGIPLVMTTDAHYVEKADKKYHDILKTMAHQKPFTCDAHFKTPEELEEYCIEYNIPLECLDNTVKIANQCNVNPKPKDERGLMPIFPCPPGYTGDSYLRELCFDALYAQVKKKKFKDIKKRLKQMNYELDVICSMGFADYFLILWDWFKWCRDNGILMGKGRGSGAGSIVSYVLSITTMDPIKNGFFFERFLNVARIEFPDIDSDISRTDRARGIEYLLNKYGTEYVSQIITFSEYKLKNTLKSAMSAYGYSYEEANEATKSIPDAIDGETATYDYIMKIAADPDEYEDLGSRTVAEVVKVASMLTELFKKYPEVYDAVTHLNGCLAGTGIHAGGVIVSSKILRENMPLISGSDTAVLPLVQIPMSKLDFFKALKIDVLGLNTLTQIKGAMDLTGLDYDWYDSEDFDDPAVYEMLRKGETTDVFQMAGFMSTRMIQDMKVEDLEGLNAVNAGNRPGPLAKNKISGKSMVDNYIENKASGSIPKIHPLIDPILADTQGSVWYQEQCMSIGQVMAGYSLGMADLRIRKVLGKKLVKKIPEIENEFIYGKQSTYDKDHNVTGISEEDSPYCKGAVNNGFDVELAQQIFDIMREFAKYCFNRAHSGSYAAMAYKCAWLSLYYPVEWSVACLSTYDDTDKITATLSLCKKRGIKILPPDINKSELGFTVEVLPDGTKAIRYGLLAIKGIGEKAVQFLKELKQGNDFTSFDDFYNVSHNSPLVKTILDSYADGSGKKVMNPMKKDVEQALIKAGAFDEFEENRHILLNHYMLDIRKEKDFELLNATEYTRKVKLELEKELMGSYVSEHPLDPFPYGDIEGANNGDVIETTGIVKKITTKPTKNGGKYATVVIETKDGKERKVMMFGKVYDKYKPKIKKDEIIIVTGEVNKQFSNINCSKVKKIVGKSTVQSTPDVDDEEESNVIPISSYQPTPRPDPLAEVEYSPVDQLLQSYGG